MNLRLQRRVAPLLGIIALHSRVHSVLIVSIFLVDDVEVSGMGGVQLRDQVLASAFLSAVLA